MQETTMQIPLTSVQTAGVAIRTLRKRAGIRIDDFALTAGVSKQFMTDLENGKPTVQMGKVLGLLQRLNIRVSLDLPDADVDAFRAEFDKVTRRGSLKKSTQSPVADGRLNKPAGAGDASDE
jgi:transcriptional regulator with XRE-family HTH domain